jgi:hypothetical protein
VHIRWRLFERMFSIVPRKAFLNLRKVYVHTIEKHLAYETVVTILLVVID